MVAVLENLWTLVVMIALIAGSAFMSGAETAFFNITHRQSQSLRTSRHKIHNIAAILLAQPKRLLTSLLFANMLINVLFFALASVLSMNLGDRAGPAAAAIAAVAAFAMLLTFGEMLPKSLAYSHSKAFAVAAAPVCFVCVRVLSPVIRVFQFAFVAPALRLLTTPDKPGTAITPVQFKLLIDSARHHETGPCDENQIFAEVIELGLLKVRHVMRPRVDMTACSIDDPAEKILALMSRHSLTKLPVYANTIDNITGLLHQRDLILNPDTQPRKLVSKANFLPEQKTVESLLEFFRQSKTDFAIVVDEYGGIAGSVAVEDVVEEILGPVRQQAASEPIEQVGPMQYRLDANLPIHEWAQTFGIEPEHPRIATVGGLTAALLGKIPRSGDVTHLKNLQLTVEKVKKHRIQTLLLSLEPIS